MNKLILTALVLQMTLTDKLKARRESGQGTLEYVGMFAVAAIIVVTIIGLAKGFDFGGIVTAAIAYVTKALPK